MMPATYRVHVAGQVQEDGSQVCLRCGAEILEASADGDIWGFPAGRRVVEGPSAFHVITADRQLASNEVPCR